MYIIYMITYDMSMFTFHFRRLRVSVSPSTPAQGAQGEAAGHGGLRAVDLSSDQRPMREDERTRIVQQAPLPSGDD